MANLLELHGITKRFPGVLANDHIDMTFRKGTIHALVGENGAGKSTLMNIIYGLYHPDEGEIRLNGEPVRFHNPTDAISHGIGMVHQHFMLVPAFSVYENIVLAAEPRKGFMKALFDRSKAIKEVEELAARNGFKIDPKAKVANLPVGTQQRIEILKTLYRGAEILILDEPTAVLTPQETKELFVILRGMVAAGKTIIFITHKLEEVMEIADHVTVMRYGKVTMDKPIKETSILEMAQTMVGREVFLDMHKAPPKLGDVQLSVKNLWVADNRSVLAVKGLSFEIRGGEILGVAGVAGNGQTELVEAITGLRKVEHGNVNIAGKQVTNAAPLAIRQAGLAHIPEDRYKRGVAGGASAEENAIMFFHHNQPISKGVQIDYAAVAVHAEQIMEKFDVRPRQRKTPAGKFSGGNAQKLIAGREISLNTPVLIASQPTRGLDIGAIEFLHSQIVAARDAGHAVLLVSTELDEVMSLSDRIIVLNEGQLMGEVTPQSTDRESLGMLMAGVRTTKSAKAKEENDAQ